MNSVEKKQLNEQQTFARFSQRLGTAPAWLEVSSRQPPEPDLLCVHATDGPIAFELVSLTDHQIAERHAVGADVTRGDFDIHDPSEEIVRKKLKRGYSTSARHIELLIYTDGHISTPDEIIIPTIRPLFDQYSHPFTRIWFMGEHETGCLWDRTVKPHRVRD